MRLRGDDTATGVDDRHMVSATNALFRDYITVRGVATPVDAVRIDGRVFIITRTNTGVRVARLKQEWMEDVVDPARAVDGLRRAGARVDVMTFWERPPIADVRPGYITEIEHVAAIPISTYDEWWNKQIDRKTRNMVRKTEKLGVRIGEVPFDDVLVEGISKIFNQSPVRRGKPFWHYNKDRATVKEEMGRDMDTSVFIGAYFEETLIGFVKLYFTDRYAMITMILDLSEHRDKSPMNGMIAKAVEVCAARGVPHLTYTIVRRGDHGDFQKRNGFVTVDVPRYWVPLTLKGTLALKVGAHRGLTGMLSDDTMTWLLNLRARWYQGKTLYRD
jgi:hypothetical protein